MVDADKGWSRYECRITVPPNSVFQPQLITDALQDDPTVINATVVCEYTGDYLSSLYLHIQSDLNSVYVGLSFFKVSSCK